jgi:fructosamine-3-kinase
LTYTVYEYKKYLIPIAHNVTKAELKKYGKISDEFFDNYKDTSPKHAGYKLKDGIKKFYAFPSRTKDV